MLRRPATTIKLTPEDILEYDDSLALKQQASFSQVNQSQEQDKSHPIIFKEPSLSRNERMGVPDKFMFYFMLISPGSAGSAGSAGFVP